MVGRTIVNKRREITVVFVAAVVVVVVSPGNDYQFISASTKAKMSFRPSV